MKVLRALGWVALVLAGLLAAMGITALPTGGLMFALPYVFLIPAVALAGVGVVLLWLGRPTSPPADGPE